MHLPVVDALEQRYVAHDKCFVEGVEIGVENSHNPAVAHLHLVVDEIGEDLVIEIELELLGNCR